MPNREEKETRTASIHNIPTKLYRALRSQASLQDKSLSTYLREILIEIFSSYDREDARTKAKGGVPDRDQHKSSIEAFKKEYDFNDYNSGLKYQQDIRQWRDANSEGKRQHELIDELLSEEEEWIEHVLDNLKG